MLSLTTSTQAAQLMASGGGSLQPTTLDLQAHKLKLNLHNGVPELWDAESSHGTLLYWKALEALAPDEDVVDVSVTRGGTKGESSSKLGSL